MPGRKFSAGSRESPQRSTSGLPSQRGQDSFRGNVHHPASALVLQHAMQPEVPKAGSRERRRGYVQTVEVPMLIHELTKDECLDVLRHTNLGRLACSHDHQPYIVPIYFDFDGENVYSFAMRGTKIAWMESNSKVCLEVDDILDQYNWTTVLVFGRYEELTAAPEYEELRDRARDLFQKRPEWWLPASGKVPSGKESAPIVYRIRITTVNGRRAARDETVAAAAARRSRPKSDTAPPWWIEVLDPLLAKHRQ
jgi:uncharacterized protein